MMRKTSICLSLACAFSLACSASTDPDSESATTTQGGAGNTGVAGASGGGGVAQGSGGAGDSGAAGTPVNGGEAGVAGTSGSAGNGGTSTAGSGGVAGSESGGAGGSAGTPNIGPTGPSMGCGVDHSNEEPGQYTEYNLNVQGLTPEQIIQRDLPPEDGQDKRRYFTMLPEGYDPMRAYPVVFYGPGCGASNAEGTPVTGSLGNEAILVFLLQKVECFATSDTAENRSAELNYFEQALAEVQANYCTDMGKVFVSGYSSGAWLSYLLACHHGDKIRAIGTAAGGFRPPVAECVGNPAAILYGGTNDTSNPIDRVDDNGVAFGSRAGRDSLIERNGCNPENAVAWDPAFPQCQIYQDGCPNSPVVWCEDDSNHGSINGGNVVSDGYWTFWSSLP
jgi:poly(3-hydroxybutyrate) depolymerase